MDVVERGFAAKKAGLQPGDLLVRISPARGISAKTYAIQSSFDVLVAEYELAWRGPVVVQIMRNGQSETMSLPAGEWGLDSVPRLDPADAEVYKRTISSTKDTKDSFACDAVEAMAARLASESRPRDAAWLQWRCAELAMDARNATASKHHMAQATALLDASPDAAAAIWLKRAKQCAQLREFPCARQAVESVSGLVDRQSPIAIESRLWAAYLDWFDAKYEKIVGDMQEELSHCARQCQQTLIEAWIHKLRGLALRRLSRLDEAASAYTQALAIYSRMAPDAFATAEIHGNYAMVLRAKGESGRALSELESAVKMAGGLDPDSLRFGWLLNNLAVIYWSRGDFVGAEKTLREALRIQQGFGQESYDVAVSMQNLATFAVDAGDIRMARQYSEKSLQIFERVASPASEGFGIGYDQRGNILLMLGDLEHAEAELRRALEYWDKYAPNNDRHAYTLHNLGTILERRGDKPAAKALFERAVAMRKASQPGSQFEAHDLISLGSIELAMDQGAAALAHLTRATEIYVRGASRSGDYAHALNVRGKVLESQGKKAAALESYCKAEEILELQREQISASREVQSEYVAKYAEIPRDCARARLEAGDVPGGLAAIDDSSARSLRDHMLFREEVSGALLSKTLKDRRGDIFQRRASLEGQLAAMTEGTPEDRQEAARNALIDLSKDERRWFDDVAREAPGYARILQTKKFDLDAMRRALPRGTAAIVYLVGEADTYALTLSGPDHALRSTKLALRRSDVEELVADVRKRIQEREPLSTLAPLLRHAHAALLAPLDKLLAKDSRLLIVPDGALQFLPFAALQDGAGRYVSESRNLAFAPSISMALENVRTSGDPKTRLVAVGVGMPKANSALAVNGPLQALPGAEGEALAVARAYGEARSTVLVGDQANESAIQSYAEHATVLHIAAHAYFDTLHPVESALLLNPGPKNPDADDDGVVHAWEVMAHWRLGDVQLVVLSGCDTGIGRELKNEGLVGLARAFQYAGAQTVVATLWPVVDDPTKGLMGNVYQGIAEGGSVTDSLRAAQQVVAAQSRGPDSRRGNEVVRGVGRLAEHRTAAAPIDKRHPFYWAGFEVFGSLP